MILYFYAIRILERDEHGVKGTHPAEIAPLGAIRSAMHTAVPLRLVCPCIHKSSEALKNINLSWKWSLFECACAGPWSCATRFSPKISSVAKNGQRRNLPRLSIDHTAKNTIYRTPSEEIQWHWACQRAKLNAISLSFDHAKFETKRWHMTYRLTCNRVWSSALSWTQIWWPAISMMSYMHITYPTRKRTKGGNRGQLQAYYSNGAPPPGETRNKEIKADRWLTQILYSSSGLAGSTDSVACLHSCFTGELPEGPAKHTGLLGLTLSKQLIAPI